jgi:hypothetical protein
MPDEFCASRMTGIVSAGSVRAVSRFAVVRHAANDVAARQARATNLV